MEYTVGKTSGNTQAFTNCVYVKTKSLSYLKVNTDTKECIFKVLEDSNLEKEQISLNTYQRTWLNLAIGTKVKISSISSGLTKPISTLTFVAKNLLPKQNPYIEITDDIVEEKIKKSY